MNIGTMTMSISALIVPKSESCAAATGPAGSRKPAAEAAHGMARGGSPPSIPSTSTLPPCDYRAPLM